MSLYLHILSPSLLLISSYAYSWVSLSHISIKMIFYLLLFSSIVPIIHLSYWNPSLYLHVFLHALSLILHFLILKANHCYISPKYQCFIHYNRYIPYFKAYAVLSKAVAEMLCKSGGRRWEKREVEVGNSVRHFVTNNLLDLAREWQSMREQPEENPKWLIHII